MSVKVILRRIPYICLVSPRKEIRRNKIANLRMLINEAAGIVDLVVNDHVQILLPRMRRDLGVSEFLRHGDCADCLVYLVQVFSSVLSRLEKLGENECWKLIVKGQSKCY